MLEFMDRTSINAVEDMTRMGLDRGAAAMLVIQSDEPAGHAAVEIARSPGSARRTGATEVFSTDDPEEGEAFVVARRIAIPAVERTGTLLLEDVGVPLPQLGALVRRHRGHRRGPRRRPSRSSRTRATATRTR